MKVPEDLVISKEKCSPLVQAYWSSKDQIEIWSSTTEVPRLAVSSTSEEWSKTGRTSVLGFGVAIYRLTFP
jgi:hypothetical protein